MSLLITIKKPDYLSWLEEALNHPSEIALEQAELSKFGPSIHHIYHLTPFGDDVLIEENGGKDRIPHSGYQITVHGMTPEENVTLEFNLLGFGKFDRKPGEKPEFTVAQKIAIGRKEAQRAEQKLAGPKMRDNANTF